MVDTNAIWEIAQFKLTPQSVAGERPSIFTLSFLGNGLDCSTHPAPYHCTSLYYNESNLSENMCLDFWTYFASAINKFFDAIILIKSLMMTVVSSAKTFASSVDCERILWTTGLNSIHTMVSCSKPCDLLCNSREFSCLKGKYISGTNSEDLNIRFLLLHLPLF